MHAESCDKNIKKRFDLYAFGCILLELALWQRLVDIQSSYTSQGLTKVIADATNSNAEIDLPSLLEFPSQAEKTEAVKHLSGESFMEAIKLSLSMDTVADEDPDVSLKIQQAVLASLRQCKC